MALATAYILAPDFDVQPLDLSVRSTREQHWPLRLDITEGDHPCLTTTYMRDMASPDIQRVSPCVDMSDTNRHRPHAGLLTSLLSNTDMTFYTPRQASSPHFGFSGNRDRQSPYYLPPRRESEIAEEDSSFHRLSGNTDNDMCTSSGYFTTYHQHSDSDVYSQLTIQSSLASPQPHHADNDYHTGVVLQSCARAPFIKSSVDQSDKSSVMYSQWKMTDTVSPCQRHAEDMINVGCDLYNLTHGQVASRDRISDPLDTKSCLGHAVAQRYRHKIHKRTACPAGHSSDSQQTSPLNWPEQFCDPGSPDVVSSSSPDPWDLHSVNPSSPFPGWKSAGGYRHSSYLLDQPAEHTETDSQQSFYPRTPRLNHPATPGPQSKYNTPGKKRRTYKSSSDTPSDCNQVSTSTDAVGIVGNRFRSHRESPDAKLHHRSTSDDVISTPASVLDFWISKFLWERSVGEASRRKPCHVEYIMSENGQKKIRFRLVDLIELQVEQSLMA